MTSAEMLSDRADTVFIAVVVLVFRVAVTAVVTLLHMQPLVSKGDSVSGFL